MTGPSTTAGDPLAERAAGRPTAIAIETGARRVGYAELERAAAALAEALRNAVPGPGTVVGALLPAGTLATAALHAVRRAGLALAPGHPRWTREERARFMERLEPGALLLAGDAAPPGPGWARAALPAGLDEEGALWSRRAACRPLPEGVLLWTSGTQGRPRVASLAWSALLRNAEDAVARLGLGAEDAWLASLSPAHVGGLVIPLRTAVAGARLVLDRPGFDAARLRHRLDESGATHVSLVPTLLRGLLEHRSDPPPVLRCALVGGAATPRPLLERALGAGWPVALTYGLTEASSQVATAAPPLVRRRPGTVGPPLDGVSLRIDGAGEDGVGRIAVKGATVMRGYVASDGSLDGLAPGGWLETGDLGRLDDEGHLWVTGRASSRIVSGGANVDPAEVEAVLARHPLVRDVVVVGIPDPVWGERVVAAVVPADGTGGAASLRGSAAGPPSAEARDILDRWARARLTGPRRPRTWVFLDAVPRTRTGKADRAAVARRLAEGGGTESAGEGRPLGGGEGERDAEEGAGAGGVAPAERGRESRS